MRITLCIVVLCLLSVVALAANLGIGWTGTSLNAVTSTGAGTAFGFSPDSQGRMPSKLTWTVVVSGTPTSVTTNLEGSLDGTNWFTLDSSTITTSEMRHVVNKSVNQVRCNLATLSGGSSPTVTCKIGAF